MFEEHAERWEPIPEWEGLYEASNFGRIRSLDHMDCAGRRRRGRILRQSVSGSYYMVTLYRNGVKSSHTVHGLVLRTFAGLAPAGEESCHGPGGTLDNRWPQNLCYGTHQRNQSTDKERDGKLQRGERQWKSKLRPDQVLRIRKNPEGKTQRALALEYGVDQTAISLIVRRKNWAWLDA